MLAQEFESLAYSRKGLESYALQVHYNKVAGAGYDLEVRDFSFSLVMQLEVSLATHQSGYWALVIHLVLVMCVSHMLFSFYYMALSSQGVGL